MIKRYIFRKFQGVELKLFTKLFASGGTSDLTLYIFQIKLKLMEQNFPDNLEKNSNFVKLMLSAMLQLHNFIPSNRILSANGGGGNTEFHLEIGKNLCHWSNWCQLWKTRTLKPKTHYKTTSLTKTHVCYACYVSYAGN